MRELDRAELSYDGDMLESVKINKGSHVRPLWARMERLTPDLMLMWVDRFDSHCPIASEWALAQAMELGAGVTVPRRANFVRTILCELNRLVWLTTYLSRVMGCHGQKSLVQQILLLREQVFVRQEELTGGRILPQAFNVGGCRRELALGDVQKVRLFIQGWKFSWDKLCELMAGDPLIESRLNGLLPLSLDFVKKKAWWGIVGKASDLGYDSRKHRPHGAYSFVEFSIPTRKNGDARSRFDVAMEETEVSLSIIHQLVKTIPSELDPKPKVDSLKPGFHFGTAESAKGPVHGAIEVGSQNNITAVRLFTSGQRVWPMVDDLFKGIRAEDFPLALASLGLDAEEAEI